MALIERMNKFNYVFNNETGLVFFSLKWEGIEIDTEISITQARNSLSLFYEFKLNWAARNN